MLQSMLFPKTIKDDPKDAESVNHKLLVRAGFIDQLMSGSWTLLPMGLRVVSKINNIIREEMNAIGGQEMLVPLLHPKSVWNETGRWDKASEIMYKFKDAKEREFVLSFTAEEIIMDVLRKSVVSYQDLPVYVYQFSTKFRNELRARSGILRGREFMMKDLYSAHVSEEDLMDYYEKAKSAYKKIFDRLGFKYRITEADGGVFTDKNTHEYQVLADSGEDTIYYCDKCDWGVNEELAGDNLPEACPKCGSGKIIKAKSIEVGNIFPLGDWYAKKMNFYYTDEKGDKKPVWFGSYGIGPTRVMGTWVEVSHDDKGIIWNRAISPFDAHLIEVTSDKGQVTRKANEVHDKLSKAGVDVLWDDRKTSAGEKFTDADLIGIPVRLVVSEKTGDKIEYKKRDSDETELVSYDELSKLLT
jgi:prolyl-tRNA synthetase